MAELKAFGAWVLVEPEAPPKKKGSLYVPDGNMMERLGHTVGRVLSAGKGYWDKDEKGKKDKFHPMEVKPGDRVVFRGHLKEANTVDAGCFVHMKDLILILEDGVELDLALPYDN